MGNKKANKRFTARRTAGFLATIGALVMSSGVALMVAATPAGAAEGHTPVNICHATSSDTNPYVFITVDDDSKKFEAHLAHRNTPNKTWHDDTTWGGVLHAAGSPKPDLIEGLDGDISSGTCNQEGDPSDVLTSADVTFVDPTCDNGNVADFTTSGADADFAITEGSKTPGVDIVVTATAKDGFVFAGDQDELDFAHTYPAAEVDCSRTVVDPPTKTPTKHHTKTESTTDVVTPTVVHAGLTGATVQDMRGEQGLALMFAGMLMMVAAGGLGLRLRGVASRI